MNLNIKLNVKKDATLQVKNNVEDYKILVKILPIP